MICRTVATVAMIIPGVCLTSPSKLSPTLCESHKGRPDHRDDARAEIYRMS